MLLSMLTVGMIVQAQEVKEGGALQEVTIQGSKIVQRVDGQTIYPTRQQLESSTNGYSLLSKLTLPHLITGKAALRQGSTVMVAPGLK